MESGLTTGDLALMAKENCNGWSNDGNSFMWIFALLILAGGGFGNGFFGNNRVGEAYATQADIQRAVDLNSIQRGQADLAADIQRTNYEQIAAVKDASYNNLGEIRDVETTLNSGFANTQSALSAGFANMQKCCCETLRAIDGVNYNGALNTASINANTTAQIQKVLDTISVNRMADMQNQINQLQLANAVSGVVRYPSASTYYAGNNPFCSNTGCNSI